MTTFTLQDLNLMQQKALEEQALKDMAKLGAGIDLGEMFREMGEVLPNPQQAPAPQPSQISPEKVIDEMVSQFAISLRLLLTTVISSQPKQNTTPPEGNQSLQQCVALTLQQADWFKEMVEACIDDSLVHDCVVDRVDHAVEQYFAYSFDPTEHFDIDDAVANAVDDKIDQAVEDYMGNATLTLQRN